MSKKTTKKRVRMETAAYPLAGGIGRSPLREALIKEEIERCGKWVGPLPPDGITGSDSAWEKVARDVAPPLPEWWRQLMEREIGRVMPKVEEYGATDLAVMGRALVALLPPPMQNEAVGMEMACAFYALGKIGRIVSSYATGKLPREDSWHDMGVYARMAQRIRETGRWP